MTDPRTSAPSPEQIAAFAKLSAEERFAWHMDMLAVIHELAGPEIRERWRRVKDGESAKPSGR